jgi:magnesium-protoporphyrin O-methyltransferase
MSCCRSACDAVAGHFNAVVAHAELDRYRRKGLDKRARRLIKTLVQCGVRGRSALDVGGGVGMLAFELLKRGASRIVLADASSANLEAARDEATRANLGDRIRFALGDFTAVAVALEPADIVVLDRVVCCYPEWKPLLERASDRCLKIFALSYPKDRLDVRLAIAFENLRRRWRGDPFRAFVHSPSQMRATLEAAGMRHMRRTGTLSWRIDVYARLSDSES